MAISEDEWSGELTRFLDKLPLRPCIVPPSPSFCTVCGRLNSQVASACKFYPLRFERELGRTTVEPTAFMGRRDTFEIDAGFEEEDEEGETELSDAPMIEFERPERVPVARTSAVTRAIPVAQPTVMEGPAGPQEAEVELVEADLVEVIEEPAEKPLKERRAVNESTALALPMAPPETAPIEQPVPPEKMTVPAPIYHQPKIKIIATEKPPTKPEELPLPPPPPDYKGLLPPAAVHGEPTVENPPAKPEVPPETPETPVGPKTAQHSSPLEAAPSIPETPPEKPVPPLVPEQAPPLTPEKAPPLKTDALAIEKAPPVTSQPAPAPTTSRRTGGLYDIFRRKPAEPKKEVPAPEKVKNEQKKKEDEELLKKLKTIEK